MARWGFLFIVAFLAAHQVAAARDFPAGGGNGLTDQKNFVNFGGVGSYAGIGNNGIPYGGVAGGAGTSGLDGTGFHGAGGIIGTGPNGLPVVIGGTIPGGIVGLGGGAGGGAGGALPNP